MSHPARKNIIQPFRGQLVQRSNSINRGLVGYWPMNEGTGSLVFDHSGNGNHGTLTNMDPATDWVPSPQGWALNFDGSDDQVIIGTTYDIDDFSASWWSRCLIANPYAEGVFVVDATNFTAWAYHWDEGTNGMYVVVHDGFTYYKKRLDVDITQADWHFYAITWNNNNLRLFMDGFEHFTVPGLSPTVPSTTTRIGEGHSNFPGNIEINNFRLWKREIADEEVKMLYTEPFAGFH